MAAEFSVEAVIDAVFEDEKCDDGAEMLKTSEAVAENCEFNQPSILRLLFGCKIDAGSVFRSESFIWLEGIYRRMAARRSIRRPYYSEIKRDIPKEIFLVLVQSIERHKSQIFNPPNCYVARNKKAIVVSFTSIISVKNFLSSLSSKDVTGYMERTLAGYRKGHRVNVLVTDTKDFALTYYIRKGQLIISFNFGEWNAYGFPQHDCNRY